MGEELQDVEEIKLPIGEILPYARNNKIHTEKNIDEIAKSIKEFGYLSKVGVDENNVILYGEGRFFALQKLGYTEIVVQKIYHLSEEKKRAFRIIDNKLSNNSVYDVENIEKELEWLINNDYSTESSVLGYDFSGSMDDADIALDEALEEAYQVEIDDVFDRSEERLKPLEKIDFVDLFIEPNSVIEYNNLVIHNKKIEMGLDGIYIIDGLGLKSGVPHGIVFIRDNYKLLDKVRGLLVWHKGSSCAIPDEFVLNNNLEIICLFGDFVKRRFNNLLTAIPEISKPGEPTVHLFDDILQNFIPSKKIISSFKHLAASCVTNKKAADLYLENVSDINDALREIRQLHSPKIKCVCKINGEEVEF